MKNIILYIWQMPQNILGLLVILFTRAKAENYISKGGKTICLYRAKKYHFGVSLGKYIIFGGYFDECDVLHEYGHQLQSLRLGWLYLPIIGFVSALFNNIWDRLVHKKWTIKSRNKWYYNRFPENWADKLGCVNRQRF